MSDRNRYAELLRRIDERLAEMAHQEDLPKIKDRELCRRAGLKEHAMQTIRRGNKPGANVLPSLARAMDLPEVHLTEALPELLPDERLTKGTPISQRTPRTAPPASISDAEIDALPRGTMPIEFEKILGGIAEFLRAGPKSYQMAITNVHHLAERIRAKLETLPEREEINKSDPTNTPKR